MFASLRRCCVVLVLLAGAGVAQAAVHGPSSHALGLPSVQSLLSGSAWQVASTQVSGWGPEYRQWQLFDSSGQVAALFVEEYDKVQNVLHWSGELGFQGDGYLVQQRSTRQITLSNGRVAGVSVVLLHRLNDRIAIAYAVVSHDGIGAHSTDDLIRTGWEALIGTAGPYFAVRVSVPIASSVSDAAEAIATNLLAQALPVVRARAAQ